MKNMVLCRNNNVAGKEGKRMINIGIIGCGKIAQVRHIPEYAVLEDVRLYGFYDLSTERSNRIAAVYHGKTYPDYLELLADKEIDAVSVLTPNYTHAEITISALNAGKHVLCEKPMATHLQDCLAMEAAAIKSKRTLMIAQNQRLAPAHQKAKDLIHSGILGKLISFRTFFCHGGTESWSIDGANSWFHDKQKGCLGSMADLGVHKADLIVYLLGRKIIRTSAAVFTLDKKDASGNLIDLEDNAICTFVLEDNIVGTMNVSWTNYGAEDNSTSIYGTKGAMHIYKHPQHTIVIERAGQPDLYFDFDSIQTNDCQTSSGVIDLFVDSIRNGSPSPISARDVLPAMKAVFASIESSGKNGAWVDI